MPIYGKWWMFIGEVAEFEYDQPGVYELGDAAQNVTYVGSSNQIKRRLQEHLLESSYTCIGANAKFYRVEYTDDYKRRERELYDEYVRLYGRPPACNSVRP